jgi:HEAT repeat protein
MVKRLTAAPAVMRGKSALLAVAALFWVGGCFSPDPKSIKSDYAASAVPAIKEAANNGDRSAIPRLIYDLNDKDPAIRFAAIKALETMTGQNFNYRYYDDTLDRRPAIRRWQQWLAEQPNPNNP